MSLAEHARRELDLCGQYAEDPEYSESIIKAVEAFASLLIPLRCSPCPVLPIIVATVHLEAEIIGSRTQRPEKAHPG